MSKPFFKSTNSTPFICPLSILKRQLSNFKRDVTVLCNERKPDNRLLTVVVVVVVVVVLVLVVVVVLVVIATYCPSELFLQYHSIELI